MKHKSMLINAVILTVAVAAAFFAGLSYQTQDPVVTSNDPPQVIPSDTEPPDPIVSKSVAAVMPPATYDPKAPVDWDAIKKRHGTVHDPMLIGFGSRAKVTSTEIAAYNKLHIMPFNRRLSSVANCIRDDEFREQQSAHSETFPVPCPNRWEHPRHPYNELSNEDLEALSVTDAVASIILGQRLLNEPIGAYPPGEERVKHDQEELQLFLRAAAISEKTGPLMMLAERRYTIDIEPVTYVNRARSNDEYTLLYEKVDALHYKGVLTRFALETIAQKLGDPRANPEKWQQALLNRSVKEGYDPQEMLALTSLGTQHMLRLMREIQRNVTGSVQVSEVMDDP